MAERIKADFSVPPPQAFFGYRRASVRRETNVTEALQLGALLLEQTSPSQIECAANELAVNQPISSVDEKRRNALPRREALDAVASLRLHWPENLMEVAEMGLYLFLTCLFATLLQHPASPIRHIIPNGILCRAVIGASVCATVFAIAMT